MFKKMRHHDVHAGRIQQCAKNFVVLNVRVFECELNSGQLREDLLHDVCVLLQDLAGLDIHGRS